MASPDGVSQPHFVPTDLGGLSLPPIPEHECFTGRGELQLVVASSRASSLLRTYLHKLIAIESLLSLKGLPRPRYVNIRYR